MRRLSLIIATSATLAVLTQTAGAYAAAEPVDTFANASAAPSVEVVLNDIAGALAEQPAAPVAIDRVAVDMPGNASVMAPANDLPVSGSEPAEATAPTGTLTMDLPATGTDLTPTSDTTALFDGTAPDTTVAVQETTKGLRALVRIDSAEAPERFNFPIGGDVTGLRPSRDGGVEALNANGEVIATAPAPWATDAKGVAVPTHYEINGTTLTQVVEHRAGNYEYGIVADPWWNPFSWNWGKIGSYIAKGAKMTAKVALCASAIGLAVYPGAKAYKAIKEIGGVKKAAQLFVGAGKISDVKALLPGAAESILGITAIKQYCF